VKGIVRRAKEGFLRRVRNVWRVTGGLERVAMRDGGVGGAEGRKMLGSVAIVDCIGV